MIPEPVLIAFFTTIGAIAAAIAAVYTTRRTVDQAARAAKHDEAAERDRTGLDGLRELALQNRADREEMRADREEMRQQITRLSSEHAELQRRVAQLEVERARDRATIADLRADIDERKRVRHNLLHYIRILREFIVRLGGQPPEPDVPLPMD